MNEEDCIYYEVYLDGKRIAGNIVGLSESEGWVDIEDLSVLKDKTELPTTVDLPVKRLRGKVELRVAG